MCHSDSSKRPGLHELLRHEFFTDTTRTITNLPLALKVASQAAVSPSVSARNEVSRAVASSTNPVMKFAQQDSFMNMGSRYETDFDGEQ